MKLEEELRTEKFKTEQQRAALSILFTSSWIEVRMNECFKQYGISQEQYNVLRILKGQKGKPANLSTVQERMIHRMSNATRLVEKLKLKGYVNRVPCEDNRRKVEITITDKGLVLLEQIDPRLAKAETDLFNNLTEQETQQIGQLLDKLRH
jgi:DNA-binding MarR family transcriptional regulator